MKEDWTLIFAIACWCSGYIETRKFLEVIVGNLEISFIVFAIESRSLNRPFRMLVRTKSCLIGMRNGNPSGWIKINVDGSLFEQSSKAACAGVFWDELGEWVLGFKRKLGP